MTKTKEELTQLKIEYETLNSKLKELSEDELKLVTGGLIPGPFTAGMKKDEYDKSGPEIVHRKSF